MGILKAMPTENKERGAPRAKSTKTAFQVIRAMLVRGRRETRNICIFPVLGYGPRANTAACSVYELLG